jgi:hypothetical protein
MLLCSTLGLTRSAGGGEAAGSGPLIAGRGGASGMVVSFSPNLCRDYRHPMVTKVALLEYPELLRFGEHSRISACE